MNHGALHIYRSLARRDYITMHSYVVAVQYSGITMHVLVYMGDQNIDLRHWDNLDTACSTSKLEISEFKLDWFLWFKFESFEAIYSIILKDNDILCCIWNKNLELITSPTRLWAIHAQAAAIR